jgi:hypothetical protein
VTAPGPARGGIPRSGITPRKLYFDLTNIYTFKTYRTIKISGKHLCGIHSCSRKLVQIVGVALQLKATVLMLADPAHMISAGAYRSLSVAVFTKTRTVLC